MEKVSFPDTVPDSSAYTIAPIPLPWRIAKGVVPAWVGLMVSGLLLADSERVAAAIFLFCSLWVAWKLFRETETKAPTMTAGAMTDAAKSEADRVEQLEREARERKRAVSTRQYNKFFEHWLVRYLVALFMIVGGAWFMGHGSPIMGGGSILVGAFLAREMTLILLLIGAAYFIYGGIAQLPVSAAIIVGAIIIALALRR